MKRLMISTLLAALLIAALCPATETEPNETPLGVKFTFSDQEGILYRALSSAANKDGVKNTQRRSGDARGGTRPTHMAEVRVTQDYANALRALDSFIRSRFRYVGYNERDRHLEVFARIESSSISERFSEAQRAFLDTGFAVWNEPAQRGPGAGYFVTCLCAVSEADAKRMAQAYLDGLEKNAKAKTLEVQQALAETKNKLAQMEADLPKKQAELKICKEQFDPLKKARCEFGDLHEAIQSAKQTIAEMDKMLDTLEIELVGLREKVKAIESFRKPNQTLHGQVQARLDEMFVEFMIEQSGLEARREKAALIRAKEERFLRLEAEHSQLKGSIGRLYTLVPPLESQIRRLEEVLAERVRTLKGPKVFENTVILHRKVEAETPEEKPSSDGAAPTD